MIEHNKDMTVAQILFAARTLGRRKREISTISKLLCIREEYLLALEKGDYRVIPEDVYIFGFARNYAIELGLNPDDIVSRLKKELGLADGHEVVHSGAETEAKKDLSRQNDAPKKTGGAKSGFFSKTSRYFYKHWKGLILGIIALAIVVFGMSLVVSLGNQANDNDAEPVETVAVVAKEPEYKTAVREIFGAENRAGARVILQATQETWVKIEGARGNTVFSRVLVPGDVYYVPDGDNYRGTFGNAGGIDIWADGVLAPKLGANHVRKTGVLLSPESLTATELPE